MSFFMQKLGRLQPLGPLAQYRLRIARRLAFSFLVFWLLTLVTPLSLPFKAEAATRTWDGGCGADTSWSCDANWSTDTEPVAGDTVTFDNTSDNNSTVDATFTGTVTTININSGYDGTITLERSLTVSTSYVQAAGSFTAAAQTLDLNGTFTLSAGTFTASSGSTTLAGAMTISGTPTFNHNGGTFAIDGTGGATISCNNVAFNLVTMPETAGSAKTIQSNCALPLGVNPNVSRFTLNGTLSGSGTINLVNGTTTFNSGGLLSGFNGITSQAGVVFAGGTADFSSYTTADFNSTFSVSTGATFIASSGLSTFASTFTLNAGSTFNANGGTVTFDGSTGTLTCNSTAFNLVTFAHTSTKTVSSDCSLPLGNDPTITSGTTADLIVNGTLSGIGTLTIAGAATGNLLTLNSTASLSGFSGLVAGAITSTGATTDFGSYSTFDVNGAFTLSSAAVFTAPSGTATFASTFTLNSGTTFNANGGTVTFDGSTATLSCNNAVFNMVIFNNTSTKTVGSDCNLPLGNNPAIAAGITLNGTLSGTGTLNSAPSGTTTLNTGYSLSGFTGLVVNTFTISGATANFGSYTTFDVNGAFTLSSGAIFTAPSGTATFASTFTLNSGTTFNANGGTVTFDGSTATLSCNNTVFNLVVFNNTNIKTVGSDCSMPLGNNPTATSGITLNGMLSGSGTLTIAATLTNNASSSLVGFNGYVGSSDSSNFTVAGATVDFSTYGIVDINSDFTLSSGTFTAPPGEMTISDEVRITGGTFNANGGTVTFDDIYASYIQCNNVVFNLVKINGESTKTVGGDCTMPLGNNPISSLGGTIVVHGTLSGTGTFTTTGALQLNAGYTLTGFSGLVTGDLAIDGNTADFSGYSVLNVGGNFTLSNPTVFKAPAGIFNVTGNFSAGTDGGRLRLPDIIGNYASAPDSAALSIAGDIDVRARVALEDWTPGQTARLVMKRTVTAGGESYGLNVTTSGLLQLVLSTDGTVVPSASSSVATGIADGTTNWVRVTWRQSDKRVQFFTASGTLSNPSGADWTQLGTDQTINIASIFDGTQELAIGRASGGAGSFIGNIYRAQVINNVLDNGTGIVFDADFTNHTTGTTSFTESSANAATVSINGSQALIVASGSPTFNANGGTVVLNGTDQSIVGTTFYNLTKTCGASCTLTMPAGSTETIQGTLTLAGTAGQLLSVVSSSPGTPWLVNAANSTLGYLAVSDSQNIGSTLVACNSTDAGGNSGWSFNPSSCNPVTTTSSSSSGSSGYAIASDTPSIEETPSITQDGLTLDGKDETGDIAKDQQLSNTWKYLLLALLIGGGLGGLLLLAAKRRRKQIQRPAETAVHQTVVFHPEQSPSDNSDF